MAAQDKTEPRPVTGMFTYMADSVEKSLFRNGKVIARRNKGGVDEEPVGLHFSPQPMEVLNARLGIAVDGAPHREHNTFDAHGFELRPDPLHQSGLGDFDFNDNGRIVSEYYAHCAKLVKEATGAEHVFAFDHNVRSTAPDAGKRHIAGGNTVVSPAAVVHGDYSLTSAPQRLRDFTLPPKANDTLSGVLPDGHSLLSSALVERALAAGGRFGIVNVWRNTRWEPVQKAPLACCDPQSIETDDLVVFEIHYVDRIGENYFAKKAETHRWYYYPEMTRDEALLLKTWDSAGLLGRSQGKQSDKGSSTCTFSFHSAFRSTTEDPDAPDRESIEVRCIVIWPPETPSKL